MNSNNNNNMAKCEHCKSTFDFQQAIDKEKGENLNRYEDWWVNLNPDNNVLCYPCFYYDTQCSQCNVNFNMLEQVDMNEEYSDWYFYTDCHKDDLCYQCFCNDTTCIHCNAKFNMDENLLEDDYKNWYFNSGGKEQPNKCLKCFRVIHTK
jgi:hypothetical protein